ncbi:MAG: CheR family methyltransferase [Anaerolineae bacterium]
MKKRDRTRLRELIGQFSGLDTSTLSDDVLEAAVQRRLAAHDLARLADYWPLLRGLAGAGEMGLLVQGLTNKETFFFREMHHYLALRDHVLPELLSGRDRPLRLWSAGCATGEEAYSLAITLLEAQAHHGPFEASVLATDLDRQALARAKEGCYTGRALRLVPDDLQQRYFRQEGDRHCVLPEVARLVTFRPFNLATGRRPTDLFDVDVIFCRNVTIYFALQARDRLNARLARALREGGYLFVASAETMSHNLGRLEMVSLGSTFVFYKGERPSPLQEDAAPAAAVPEPAPEPEPKAAPDLPPLPPLIRQPAYDPVPEQPALPVTPMRRAQQAFQEQDYEAALQRLEQMAGAHEFRPDVGCLEAAIFLQQERLDEAEAACQKALVHDPWYADAHFLLGLIARQRGEIDSAVQALKQVIYLQPEHRDAHFFLAEILRNLKLYDAARREYENTLNILNHRPSRAATWNLAGVPDQVYRRACEANLKNLKNRGRGSV